MVSILAPAHGTFYKPTELVECKSDVAATWSYQINGGASTTFATGTTTASFNMPDSVQNQDANGNKTEDAVQVRAEEAGGYNPSTVTVYLNPNPKKPCTKKICEITDSTDNSEAVQSGEGEAGGLGQTVEVANGYVENHEYCPPVPDCYCQK